MNIYTVQNYEALCTKSADLISELIQSKPNCNLGLATGSTPLGIYEELVKRYKNGSLDFSKAKSFNLDEYWGLSQEHPCSYSYYMRQNLFDHINMPEPQRNIPSGTASSAQSECFLYDQKISEAGHLDLLILGIGRNGHIGFNEPAQAFNMETHLVELDTVTRQDNARYFKTYEKIPSHAITMGIQSIMNAKQILLIASGSGKTEALSKMRNGQIDPSLPASILQLHENVTVIQDVDAAGLSI